MSLLMVKTEASNHKSYPFIDPNPVIYCSAKKEETLRKEFWRQMLAQKEEACIPEGK